MTAWTRPCGAAGRPALAYAPADLCGGPEAPPAWRVDTPERNDGVTAVLGPTNTGKTHYAIERMLSHRSGVIGFPLRLLAREVYDRVVARLGPREVALITGEEKIVPPKARYYLCTVESMPLDWGADFVAVDEIQLCADPERGHVFTNRLLSARGVKETLFLGAASIRQRIDALVPGARFLERERLSTLSYAGSKKISRLPARSAVVAFSVDNVYAIAELIRRQKGGAAVVMGALSPRTRNAQVALYQEGDVDYLVATDAIGMGLNLDLKHVAFAGLAKFDGRRHRRLEAQELAQIAGRAGRHMEDGSFGVTGEAPPLSEEMVDAIEKHRFQDLGRLHWRCARLDYASPESLLASLEREPGSGHLLRAREADDVAALRALSRDDAVRERARGRRAVSLLWEVCQIPDFRKTMPAEHAALLTQIYHFLSSDSGVVPEEWIAAQCARLDRAEGDIDALSKRLAYIRTWTYVANRSNWLDDPAHWREKTRATEDRLSDALHQRLTQRFVDRRTSVLARRLKQKETLVAIVDDKGAVTVEGEFIGRIEGFRFQPDPSAAGAEAKTLQAASAQALQAEFAKRVQTFYNAPDAEIALTEQGGLMWGDAAVGRLEAKGGAAEGADPLAVRAAPFLDETLDPALAEKIERRLQFWIDRKIETVFEPLIKLRDDQAIEGLARGVAFQLIERLGVIPRQEIADQVKALDQDARRPLRAHQVRFGQHTVFIPALLKPAATRLRLILWGVSENMAEIPSPPPPGHVTIPADPEAPKRYYAMAGYHRAGTRAIRLDMLERLADLVRPLDARAGFEATPDMLSITGATLDQFAEMMEGLGYRAEKGERPKTPKPATAEETTAAETAEAETAAEGAAPAPESGADEGKGETEDAAAPADAEAPLPEAAAEAAAEAPTTATREDAAPAEAPAQDASQAEAAPPEETAPEEEAAPQEEAATAQTAEAEAASTGSAPSAEAAPAPPEPSAEAAAPTADETAAAPPEEAAEASETEVFYTFRSQPRGRRGREDGGRRGEAGEGRGQGQGRRRRRDGEDGGAPGGRGQRGQQSGGENRQDNRPERRGDARKAGGGGPRGDRQDGQRQDRQRQDGQRQDGQRQDAQNRDGQGRDGERQNGKGGGKRGGPQGGRDRGPGGGGGQGQGRGRREAKIDPDSPFAVLQQLKNRE